MTDTEFRHPVNGQVLFHVTDENGERIQMLKISTEGFFIRDSKESVAPENAAREVYDAFKLFLALSKTINTTKQSFKEEYLACLKSREEQYLKHNAAEQDWIKERADLKSQIAEVQAAKDVRGSADSVAPSIWLGPVRTIDNSRTWTRTSPSSSSLSTRSLKDRDEQYLRHTVQSLLLRTKIEQLEAEVQAAKARHSDLANDVLKPALTRILELEEELREWRCDTVPGRCNGCPDCQPIGPI
jgi:hypothetical protein